MYLIFNTNFAEKQWKCGIQQERNCLIKLAYSCHETKNKPFIKMYVSVQNKNDYCMLFKTTFRSFLIWILRKEQITGKTVDWVVRYWTTFRNPLIQNLRMDWGNVKSTTFLAFFYPLGLFAWYRYFFNTSSDKN